MILEDYIYKFLKENYDYLYLSSRFMYKKNRRIIVTGSSHGLLGIDIYRIGSEKAVNISMHSQDVYYSGLSVEEYLNLNHNSIQCCVMVFGYYTPFQDLSRAGNISDYIIKRVFWPIYHDSHHLRLNNHDLDEYLWENMPDEAMEYKSEIKTSAVEVLKYREQYINDINSREPYYALKKKWRYLDCDEKDQYGKKRAAQHNKHTQYEESYNENIMHVRRIKKIVNDNGGEMIIIIPPYSKAYYKYLNKEMIKKAHDFFSMNADLFIDYNSFDEEVFNDDDFVDTDHLNGRGAYKFSNLVMKQIERKRS